MIYCLLDCSEAVGVNHLRAALAFWRYSVDSAAFIFGGVDAVVTEIYDAMMAVFPGEMTRDDLHRSLGRHTKSSELTRALTELERLGVAQSRTEPTPGRHRDLWKICARQGRKV